MVLPIGLAKKLTKASRPTSNILHTNRKIQQHHDNSFADMIGLLFGGPKPKPGPGPGRPTAPAPAAPTDPTPKEKESSKSREIECAVTD
jgi:hypothetical protein